MKQHIIRPGQLALLLAIALVHVSAWFAYYGELPAGQYQIDEARATLDSARAIAEGQSSEASVETGTPLYTYALSLLARFSETDEGITAAARALNALAILWITGICASTASRYWQSNRAVWIAGLLVGLNPMLVFWAAEISPALLAAACMSSAVIYLLPWFKQTSKRSNLIIALSLTLASALQTALLPIALLWPLLACLYPIQKKIVHLGISVLPPVILFALVFLTELSFHTPWQWETGPLAEESQSIYTALANQETPQGKSFSLYRELHFFLLLNPIHWGALFLLACAGFYARLKEHPWSPTALVAMAMLLLFALSFSLNDGGSQTRASLLPLMAIFAAGAYQIPRIWQRLEDFSRLRLIFAGLLLAVFSYAADFVGDPSKQWESDYVYLARANLAMDQNDRATTWAEKALELKPGRLDMQEVLVLAQFNEWALSSQPRTLPAEIVREYLAATEQVQDKSTLRTIRAIYQYKLRNSAKAVAGWQAEKATCPLALLCLYWTGNIQQEDLGNLEVYSGSPYHKLLIDAVRIDRNALGYTDIEKQVDNLLALAY